MIKRIVILGGGTGGTLAANRLRHELGDTAAITVVDRNNDHLYQPGLLFVPFGLARPDRIVRPRARQLGPGSATTRARSTSVDPFGLTRDDFIGQVKDIITVGEYYDLVAGGQIIFT